MTLAQAYIPENGYTIGIIGTGVNGKAISQGMLLQGYKVVLLNRTRSVAESFRQSVEGALDYVERFDGERRIGVVGDYDEIDNSLENGIGINGTDAVVVCVQGDYTAQTDLLGSGNFEQARAASAQVDSFLLHNVAAGLSSIGYQGLQLYLTNPSDVMTWASFNIQKSLYSNNPEVLGPDPRKFYSVGHIMDTTRATYIILDLLGLPRTLENYSALEAHVLGMHGSAMFTHWSGASLNGEPIIGRTLSQSAASYNPRIIQYNQRAQVPRLPEIRAGMQITEDILDSLDLIIAEEGTHIMKGQGRTTEQVVPEVLTLLHFLLFPDQNQGRELVVGSFNLEANLVYGWSTEWEGGRLKPGTPLLSEREQGLFERNVGILRRLGSTVLAYAKNKRTRRILWLEDVYGPCKPIEQILLERLQRDESLSLFNSFQVDSAPNVDKARRLLQTPGAIYDVIIVDYKLSPNPSDETGIDFFMREINGARTRFTPEAIILSGEATKEAVEEAVGHFYAFVEKSRKDVLDALYRAVRSILLRKDEGIVPIEPTYDSLSSGQLLQVFQEIETAGDITPIPPLDILGCDIPEVPR